MNRLERDQKCLMILGMHRSGTSALARVINLLGADLGKNLVPADEDNKKGYWEHEEILHIHERLLKELGYVWDDIRPLPDNWWLGEAAAKGHADLLDALNNDFEHSSLWAIKEPRMCRLVKLWRPIFAELKVRPHFIIIFRNPMEVAASLAKRDGILTSKSFLLWLVHILESETDTRDYPRAFVSMEQLMNDWQATIEGISRTLRIEWNVDYAQIETEIAGFLDRGLKHHNVSTELMGDNPNIPPPVMDIYHALMDTVIHQRALDVKSFSRVAEHLYKEMAHFSARAFMEDVDGHVRIRADLENRLQRTLTELWETQSNLARAQHKLDSMLNSRSWKMTAPLRQAYDFVHRFRT